MGTTRMPVSYPHPNYEVAVPTYWTGMPHVQYGAEDLAHHAAAWSHAPQPTIRMAVQEPQPKPRRPANTPKRAYFRRSNFIDAKIKALQDE